ncbi:MAG: WG repeat-containing protein [Flavobacteriales bacterium]|nr:WG repeat-containing protein [Flavobacteriales bacterium]
MREVLIFTLLFVAFTSNAQRAFKDSNGKFGLKDDAGNVILPASYEDIPYISSDNLKEGAIMAKQAGKWGLIDLQGNVLIPFKYDQMKFNESIAMVKLNDKYGFVDKNDKLIIPFIYENACSFDEGLTHVRKDGKVGFIDTTGKVVIPFEYKSARCFNGEFASVENSDLKNAFINRKGELVTPFAFRAIYMHNNGLGVVINSIKEISILDIAKNRVIITAKKFFYFEHGFSEGLLAVNYDANKWGYINENGEIVIKYKFDHAYPFENGKAKVKLGERVFFIDKTGKEIKE